jgi:TM2 domain-containing membrane protein YozV
LFDASYLTRYATGWRASSLTVHERRQAKTGQAPYINPASIPHQSSNNPAAREGSENMSVQYDLAPQLSPAQQETLQRAYDARAKNPTTAFLLCYFLGVFGAHRIYLGQWGAAALRLLLPLVAVGLAILGFLGVLSFAAFSLAVITLVCALIWEALDLARMDREVSAANAALMNRLLATMGPDGPAISPVPERQALPPEPQEPPTQPEPTPTVAADTLAEDAGMAAAAAINSSAVSTPEPIVSVPEPEPTPLTFEPTPLTLEPAPELEPAPPPTPDYPAVPLENVSPPSVSNTSTLTPTASAYVPPVAPEIITGGFAASPAASPAEEPASPPIWPGADAPTWPGIGAAPEGATQPQPDPLPAANAQVAEPPQEPIAAPPPETPPAAPKLKHIRVRRKIMLDDGTIVGEQALEDDFPIEMDTQEAAKILEARFQQMSLEEIARQANLPPGTDLQLKRE